MVVARLLGDLLNSEEFACGAFLHPFVMPLKQNWVWGVKTHIIYSIGQAGNVTCAIVSSSLLLILFYSGYSKVWILLFYMTVTSHHKVSATTLMVSAQF